MTNTTDYAYLHEAFGTSWVVDPDEWLFKQRDIVSSIENDIAEGSPFVPIYEPLFTNEQLQLEANEASYISKMRLLKLQKIFKKLN